MRSTEFIREAGRNGSMDDSGTPVQNAQADAARIAQGEKNLNAIKGFFGAKPTELKDAPPGTSIDPVQRSRMGYKPATQQEIAAFQAANPNYGKVVDRNGTPIKSGTPGVTWDAGGEKSVVQTAQAAAPMSKGDAHAGQQGYNTDLERIPGAAQRDQGGYDYQPPAAPIKQAATPAADDSAVRAAAADAGRSAIKSTETNPELGRIAQLAGVQGKDDYMKGGDNASYDPRVYGAAHAGQGGTAPEIIRPNAMAAPGEPPVADVDVYKRSEMDDFGREGNRKKAEPIKQTSTPTAKAFVPDPAGVAIAQQLKMDTNAIKLFQKNQGLNPDGQIGPKTTAALKAAQLKQGNVAASGPGGARGGAAFAATDPRRADAAGAGRGQQGGPTAPQPYEKTMPPIGKQQAATPAVKGPVSTGRQPWEHTPPAPAPVQTATPVPAPINRGTNTKYKNPPATNQNVTAMRESNFDASIDQMRRLSTMLKG